MYTATLVVPMLALLAAGCSTPEPRTASTPPTPTSQPQPTKPTLAQSTAYTGTGASSSDRVQVPNDAAPRGLLPYDAIEPIYDPAFVSAEHAALHDDDYVIGVALNGDTRAYPINVLVGREMVNDVVGEVPILVTW